MAIGNRQSAIRRRSLGLSLIELLVALAITTMLLTATMVALNASFKAYADAARQASAQSGTRMVTQRLLTLVRTSTAHGPLEPDPLSNPPVTLAGDIIHSHYIELLDARGNIVRIEYRADQRELWLVMDPGTSTQQAQPLIGGVRAAQFFGRRRMNNEGLWVLDRGSIDFTIEPADDTTLYLEQGATTPIRVVASTMPRKVE